MTSGTTPDPTPDGGNSDSRTESSRNPIPDPGDGPAGEDLAVALRIAVMRTSRRLRIEASGDLLTAGRYSVLAALERGPATPGALAARERVQAPSMTRIIKLLEADGFIERHAHPEDGRQVLAALTEAGREVLDRARRQRTAWLHRRVDELDDGDRAVLARAAALLQGMSAQ
ncbi:MarR family winged helix-turn-helix transcriptional regulator [Zafaria sp. Z1313]|uniref:MarR family winged helix-turn-helix transcriptional regulator n=1 Tax=Zafaria sp. Z1313 TaxID=3423202 RepID=UPI003D302563